MELWTRMRERFSSDTADLKIISVDTAAAVQEAVEALSPQRKMVFQLSREEGLTYEQIARRLQISTNTVRNHLTASLQFIRGHLNTGIKSLLCLLLLP
jgi:RNA polymerase sigma-70 factor (ECF subfamily)